MSGIYAVYRNVEYPKLDHLFMLGLDLAGSCKKVNCPCSNFVSRFGSKT